MITKEKLDKIMEYDGVTFSKMDKAISDRLSKYISEGLDINMLEDYFKETIKKAIKSTDMNILVKTDKLSDTLLGNSMSEAYKSILADAYNKIHYDEMDKVVDRDILDYTSQERNKMKKFGTFIIDNNLEGIREFLSNEERSDMTNTNLLFTLLKSRWFDIEILNLLILFFNNETITLITFKKNSSREEKMTKYIHNGSHGDLPEFRGLSSLMVACKNNSIDKTKI